MSAIAGIVALDRDTDNSTLIERLTLDMTRRGPDGRAHWTSANMSLGHCMLRTTPESLCETQPTASRDGQLVIVMDGRLDNLDELRRELNTHGSLPPGTPDAEYVLAGYERWGQRVARRLLGDFAFIICDLSARTLYCARDCMGAKPLWFVKSPRFVAFASNSEAFLRLPGHIFRPNAEFIANLFVPDIPLANEFADWNENVTSVGAGEYLTVDAYGRLERQRYWPFELPPIADFRDEAEASEAFEQVFSEALRCRMRASGSVAALMSGGMDSAAIAALSPRVMRELGISTLATFSAVSAPDDSCIESEAIMALIASPDVFASTTEVPSLKGGLDAEDLVKVAWQGVHPIDNSLLIVLALGLTAHRAGHRVLLHGASGDLTAYSPFWYTASMLRQGRLVETWREMAMARQFHTYLLGMPMRRLLFRNVAAAFAPLWLRDLRVRVRYSLPVAGKSTETPFLNREFERSLNIAGRRFSHALSNARNDPGDWRGSHLSVSRAIETGLSGYDRTGAQLGIETRDPWGDRRVVDFFLSLPLDLKVNKGRTKYHVRATCAPRLPGIVPWRLDKSHVGWKFTDRLMQQERATLNSFLSRHADVVAPYLDVDQLLLRAKRFTERGGTEDLDFCYQALVLIRWLRRMTTA